MRISNSMIIALLALAGEGVLAWNGKPTGAMAAVAGLYIGSRAAQKGAMVYASSRDPNSDTNAVIEKLK